MPRRHPRRSRPPTTRKRWWSSPPSRPWPGSGWSWCCVMAPVWRCGPLRSLATAGACGWRGWRRGMGYAPERFRLRWGLELRLLTAAPRRFAVEGIQVIEEVGEATNEGIARLHPLEALTRFPGRAALGVGKHRIGLVHKLEALLGHRIAAVEIRMPAAGLGAESALEGLGIGPGLQTQNRPVIGGGCGGHRPQTSPQGSLSSQLDGGALRRAGAWRAGAGVRSRGSSP